MCPSSQTVSFSETLATTGLHDAKTAKNTAIILYKTFLYVNITNMATLRSFDIISDNFNVI
jgi:hypothetical protein